MKYLPHKLTLLCFKIYYKKEKYLKVRTAVFKYITSPYSKGSAYKYVGILVYYFFIFLHSYILNSII